MAGRGGGRAGVVAGVWLLLVVCWLVKALAIVCYVPGSNEAAGQLPCLVLPLVGLCQECFEQPAA